MRIIPALAGLTATLLSAPLAAQAPITYEQYTLPNGLAVFLVPNRTVPVVTVNVWYDVGSRLERSGRSGFAHLFEHMMFQGSANVGKGEHFQLIERAGGNMNGTTSEDRTNYFETLPSNRLNLGLWLEADRMRSLAITDDNFENQRETVKEERRRGVDNQPYAGAFIEGLPPAAYDSSGCFGYSHSVIGSMDDLNAATTADVQAFFDLHYAPNNATLTVTGDFESDEAKRLIERYFGDIPRGTDPPPFECEVAFGAGAKRVTWEDALANLPAAFVAYRIPEHRHQDGPALTLLNTVLGEGESSRLNRGLVRDRQVAVQSATFEFSRRGPGLLLAFAVANQGHTADTLAAALHAEAARVADQITPDELEKAKNSFRRDHVFSRQTSMGLAEAIQHYVHFHDSVDEVNTDAQKYLAVTIDDLRRVARRYLVPENSITVLVVPKGQGVTP